MNVNELRVRLEEMARETGINLEAKRETATVWTVAERVPGAGRWEPHRLRHIGGDRDRAREMLERVTDLLADADEIMRELEHIIDGAQDLEDSLQTEINDLSELLEG